MTLATEERFAALIVGYSVAVAEWRNMMIEFSLRVTSSIRQRRQICQGFSRQQWARRDQHQHEAMNAATDVDDDCMVVHSENFSLRCVQLEAVRTNPLRNMIDMLRDGSLATANRSGQIIHRSVYRQH